MFSEKGRQVVQNKPQVILHVIPHSGPTGGSRDRDTRIHLRMVFQQMYKFSEKGSWTLSASGIFMLIGTYLHFTYDSQFSNAFLCMSVFISLPRLIKTFISKYRKISPDLSLMALSAGVGTFAAQQWYEAAIVLWLFDLADYLYKEYVGGRQQSMTKWKQIIPEKVLIRSSGRVYWKGLRSVALGEIMMVRHGARFPLDGMIIAEESDHTLSPDHHWFKKGQEAVYAGTINDRQTVKCRVTRSSHDSVIARYIHLLRRLCQRQQQLSKFFDRMCQVYAPVSVALLLSPVYLSIVALLWGRSQPLIELLQLLIAICLFLMLFAVSAILISEAVCRIIQWHFFRNRALNRTRVTTMPLLAMAQPANKLKVASILTFSGDMIRLLSIAKTIEEHTYNPLAECIYNYACRIKILSLVGDDYQKI